MLENSYQKIDAGPQFVGKNLRVQKELVSDGRTSFFVDVVRFPDSVAILPIMNSGRIILERHYRHPILQTILEVPAGKLEPNEDPESGARRELLEETGFESLALYPVGKIYAAPGYSTETIYLFIARVSEKNQHAQNLEVSEKITLEKFTTEQISQLISDDKLRDSMTLSLLCIAREKKML